MLKVECEGCGSPYKVDDRRVPPGGLKMRCPKCGATFVVRKDTAEGAADKPAPAPAPAATPSLHSAAAKRTMLGVGAPGLPGLSPFAPAPAPPEPAAPPPPPDDFESGLPVVASGLPAVKQQAAKPGAVARPKPPPRPAPPKPPPAPAAGLGDEFELPGFGANKEADVPAPLDFGDISADIEAIGAPGDSIGLDDLPAVAQEAGLPAVPGPRKPPPPPKAAPRKAPPPPPPAELGFGELPLDDLPSPVGDVGLPAPVTGGVGLPAPVRGKPPAPKSVGVVDLPMPLDSKADLPSPVQHADLPAATFGKIDLPSAKGKPARQITGAALGFGEPDLPAIARPEVGLPVAKQGDFGDSFGELDLPLAVDGARDLPIPSNMGQHLPTVQGMGVNLPAPAAAGAHLPSTADPSSHLPSPTAMDRHLPSPMGSGGVGEEAEEFDMSAAAEEVWPKPPPQGQEVRRSTRPLGSVSPDSVPPGAMPDGSGPLSAAEAAAKAAAAAAVTRQAGGGTAFGEVNLGDEGGSGAPVGADTAGGGAGFGERALAGAGDDDMEFGAIPQEKVSTDDDGDRARMVQPQPELIDKPRVSTGAPQVELPAKRSKAVKILGVALLVIIAAGVGLAATPYGAFGMNAISDALHTREHGRLVTASVEDARKQMAGDTADGAARALQAFDDAVARAPRQAQLAAYASFVGFLREVRFGADPAVHAHAAALLAQAQKISKDAEYIDLARAAEAVTQGQIAKARSDIAVLLRRNANNIDAAVLSGELEMLAGDYKAALQAWEAAARIEASPRTSFGRARARFALGESDKAKSETQSVLERSPDHVGARILMARILRKTNDDEKAMALLEDMAKPGKLKVAASKYDMVAVHTLLGQINLSRSRMSNAETSFAEALKLDPKDAEALCGFGEVLYREGRFAEALARFEAAIQANAENVQAKIGAAKTKISLERLQDSKEILRKLREARPADPQVAYWLARVEEALGNKAGAERILADAVARAQPGEHVIDLYVALARYLAAAGKNQEAEAKLAEAKQKLPDTVELRKALGDVQLQAGRLDAAKAEFDTVLQRDPQDLYAMFNLGVVLLKMKRYEEAQAVFDKVSAVDKNYPGLALERGVLFEVSGQAQRALEMYQEALNTAPNDPDLQLRVGSAEIANGHASQAEEILRKVLAVRPNSAEANHYLGRALLLKGTNLAEALRNLQRAAEIDPNRAEYWLYIGWAANDAGQPAVAQEALVKALDLDKSLADAYWQRGILERRQSAVRDAERDLLKALELKPSRYEAYATLAECYEENRRWDQAQAAWRKAIAGDGNKAIWHYKLGRLLWTNHNLAEAGEEVSRAVQLSAKEARPPWLWEAYMIMGDAAKAAGKRQQAIEHYQEFMKAAPPESPYRNDVKKALAGLGVQPD
ncbi:MAG: zinc-ribbon domain-containing protein [Deltaproteobacteria bacterium]|nr:zinc-ribbon domain-containing protein [Deltaproteobacteria bacterium]